MKILFTSVGRRVELIQLFKEAAGRLNVELEIFGADITELAPALFFCDKKVIVPLISDKAYIPTLIDICRRNSIDALIPTIDTDLLLLSENAARFDAAGTKVFISAPEKIAVCRDKNYTSDFFVSCGLKAPKTYNDCTKYDGGFPCFIKPKDGSSSIDAYKISNFDELHEFAKRVDDYVIQPFVDGEEYTVDVFCSFDGSPVYITPRKRIAVRAGEVLKTEIACDEKIIGATAKTVPRARDAAAQGADYLGVGAIYPTTTKVKTVLTSVETLREICMAVDIPVNAIGGLNRQNIDVLAGIPIAGICAVSAIMKAEDPKTAAEELRARAKEVLFG